MHYAKINVKLKKHTTMKKLTLLIGLAFIVQVMVYSQSCLPDGITFTSQEQIDNFQNNYPNCTEIEGDVTISGYDISNLNGLYVVTTVGGGLNINGTTSGASLVLNVKKEGEPPKTLVASLGENEIELSKTGYLEHRFRFKVTEQKYKYDFTLSHGNNHDDQLDFNKYKKKKNIWLASTIVSAGVGTFYYFSANKHYEDYITATSEATDLHNQIQTENRISSIAFGVSGLCAIMTVINVSKQKKAKTKINYSFVSLEGGGLLSIKLNL